MNTYIVKMLFSIENNSRSKQFDMQYRWVMANNADEVRTECDRVIKNESSNPLIKNEGEVSWKFIAIRDVFRVDHLNSGDEIFSEITETEFAEEFLKNHRIHDKMDRLHTILK
ncbi:MAG: DUF4288 domain-containing protein [Flavobacteriales bacterium]|nr:DUF4288 domain-containing protein [Flavobacteriales bacterium]